MEGLGRVAEVRRREARRVTDRAGRGAGLRLRREAPDGRARRARCGATASSPSGWSGRRPSSEDTVQRGVLGRPARRLLRAGARSGQAARRLALLEHRPPADERDRAARARRRSRRRADGRGAVVGLGRQDDVPVGRGLQPARVPQRHRLAARQLADRARSRPERPSGRRRSRIVRRMFDASVYFEHSLPEVFAGFSRTETPFPIAYPTATRPQAWAAGTPVLLLQLLLGLEPDHRRHALVSQGARGVAVLGRVAQAFRRARVRQDVGRPPRRRPRVGRGTSARDARSACSARSGSRCRRPATAASNGS